MPAPPSWVLSTNQPSAPPGFPSRPPNECDSQNSATEMRRFGAGTPQTCFGKNHLATGILAAGADAHRGQPREVLEASTSPTVAPHGAAPQC